EPADRTAVPAVGARPYPLTLTLRVRTQQEDAYMNRMMSGILIVLLGLSVAAAGDERRDKAATPAEQYKALVKEFGEAAHGLGQRQDGGGGREGGGGGGRVPAANDGAGREESERPHCARCPDPGDRAGDLGGDLQRTPGLGQGQPDRQGRRAVAARSHRQRQA